MRKTIIAALTALLSFCGDALAESFPSHPITLVVPFSAGGPTDAMARILADHMRTTLGQNLVIENVTGAAGSLGVGRVVRAAPDGYTLSIGQVLVGTLTPLLLLGTLQVARRHIPEAVRKRMYFACAVCILIGVFAMRWNVVMGGQFFSKSLRGVMSYKLEFAGVEGWFMGLILLSLPFIILTVLIKLFLSERLPTSGRVEHLGAAEI